MLEEPSEIKQNYYDDTQIVERNALQATGAFGDQ